MNKLSPKPESVGTNYGWKALNDRLQHYFSVSNDKTPEVYIGFKFYAIPKEEIIYEVTKAGYTISSQSDDHIIVR